MHCCCSCSCYSAMKGEGTPGCGTCTQNLSVKKKNHNSPLNPRSGKLRSGEEVRGVCVDREVMKRMDVTTKTKCLCNRGRHKTQKDEKKWGMKTLTNIRANKIKPVMLVIVPAKFFYMLFRRSF